MHIYALGEIPQNIEGKVGGKARGLNILKNNGFVVPNGFVIYDFDGSYSEIVKTYEDLGEGEVAVRSSALNEDGGDFSNAGQFSTFLSVNGKDNLIKAIDDCIASLNNITATKYADTFLRTKDNKMSIVVQKMVNAVKAGVLFSKDVTKKDFCLIESVEGLGENLVSGVKSAQQVYVNNKTGEFELQENSLLSIEQVKVLFDGAKKCEKIFKKPIDMEWAIDEKGEIYWLQARPITVSDMPTIGEFDSKVDITNDVLTTCNIREMMPGAVTPLCLSTNMYALDWGLRELIHIVVGSKDINWLPAYSCFVPFGNHMFMNLTSIYKMNRHTFLGAKDSTDLSICGRVLTDMPDSDIKKPCLLKRIICTIRFLKYSMSGKGAKKGIEKLAKQISFNLNADIKELYLESEQKLNDLNKSMFYHYWSSFYSGAQSSMVYIMLDPHNQDDGTIKSKMAGALTEIDNIESVDILKKMRAVAKAIEEENPNAKNFTVDDVINCFENPQPKTKQAYDEFMTRHGHRGICEPEMRSLPFKKNKAVFANNILMLIKNPEKEKGEVKHWDEYANEILKDLKGLKKKIYFKFIKNARQAVYDREFTKSRFIYILDKFKDVYETLGRKLTEKKIIPDADCIYFLTHTEIGQLIDGDKSLVKKAIARRRLLPEQMELRFPEVSLGQPNPISSVDVDKNANSYNGTPVSRGIATGKARIIRAVEDANNLQFGEIMIASYTDIGWSPYYGIAGGLITEVGSSLSHGVVVAREYALPTVVNVEGIMQVVKNGDMVTINGNTGVITVERK